MTTQKEFAPHGNKSENTFARNVNREEEIMADMSRQSDEGALSAGKQILGGFELFHQIGRGASGTVFKARQLSMDRVVALKVLPPSLARNAAFIERFLREARAAAQLNHPNIVQAIDAGQAGPYYYFAMEYVAGRSAGEEVRATGPLPERRALEIVRDTARALAHAHAIGIIHRDIKPDNILIEPDGTAKLADLGLAREASPADSRLTRSGLPIGTPDYISPEQARGEGDLDGRTDIYSLGATLYHLLTGEPPYVHPSAVEVMSSHLHAPPPDPRKRSPRVSAAAAAIIRRAMSKNRDRRYPSAEEMLRDIESALAAQPPQAVSFAPRPAANVDPPPRVAARRIRRRTGAPVFIAVLIALAIVAVGAAVFWRPANSPPPATADEAFAELSVRADKLVAAGDYDGAIALFEALPSHFSGLLAPRADAKILKVKTAAEAAVGAAIAKAQQLIDAGQPDNAIAVLDAVAHIRYREMDHRIDELRRQAGALSGSAVEPDRQRQTESTRGSIGKLLDRIEAAASKNDFAAALQCAEDAAGDSRFQSVPTELRAVVEVGRALGRAGEAQKRTHADELRKLVGSTVAVRTKDGPRNGTLVEVANDAIVLNKAFTINGEEQVRTYRVRIEDIEAETLARLAPKWEPKTADEWIAEAILAFAAGDAERMKTSLEAAKGHPLRPRYERMLAALTGQR